MSQTYSIGCSQCKTHLWIAQSRVGLGPIRLYATDDHLDALEAFLTAHQGHPLVFGDNCEGDPIGFDWTEVKSP